MMRKDAKRCLKGISAQAPGFRHDFQHLLPIHDGPYHLPCLALLNALRPLFSTKGLIIQHICSICYIIVYNT